MGWLETWLIEWLKGQIYYSFEALNHDIRNRVSDLAERPFKHREGSRKSVYEALDKPALRPMPKDTFESFLTKFIKRVPNNYHVEYCGFYYSVPYQYYDQPAVMHIYARRIEIYNNDGDRIAIHQRAFSGKRYITDATHMPANHRAVVEMRSKDGTYYRSWSSSIGPNTNQVITVLLEKADFEEQAYKSCMGVIGFAKTYGNSRLEKACKKAISLNSVTYTTVRNILKNNQDSVTETAGSSADTPTPYHENLRTGEWK